MKERSAFIVIIALLAVALFAGWLMMSRRQRATDEQRLANVKADLKRLEDRINSEIRNIEEGTFAFSSSDSLRSELSRISDAVGKDRRAILSDEKKAIAEIGELETKVARYDEFISGVGMEKQGDSSPTYKKNSEKLRLA
jgi:HAMP domain-containing protein